jgi:hypothetical protein
MRLWTQTTGDSSSPVASSRPVGAASRANSLRSCAATSSRTSSTGEVGRESAPPGRGQLPLKPLRARTHPARPADHFLVVHVPSGSASLARRRGQQHGPCGVLFSYADTIIWMLMFKYCSELTMKCCYCVVVAYDRAGAAWSRPRRANAARGATLAHGAIARTLVMSNTSSDSGCRGLRGLPPRRTQA